MLRLLSILFAFSITLPLQALELVSPEGSPVTVYTTDEDYASVKEMIEMGITGKGLVITNTLHISDMYERTSGDLGLEKKLYQKAESFEFCSILLSYKMSEVHPANLAICPLTIGFYQPHGDESVYVSYTNAKLLGDGAAVEGEIDTLLDEIIHDALD